MPKPTRSSLAAAAAKAGQQLKERSQGIAAVSDRHRHSFEAETDRIRPDPDQARRHFDEGALRELASSMAAQGLLQPVGVAPDGSGGYRLVWGERRWRAARLLGWDTILAVEAPANPRVAALMENLHRADLTPLEEALAFARMLEEGGYSQTQLAAELGKSKTTVSQSLALLELHPDIRAELEAGTADVPKRTLYEVARAPREVQLALWKRVRAGSVDRDAAKAIARGRQAPPAPSLGRKVAPLSRVLGELRQAGAPLADADRRSLEALRRLLDELLAR